MLPGNITFTLTVNLESQIKTNVCFRTVGIARVPRDSPCMHLESSTSEVPS